MAAHTSGDPNATKRLVRLDDRDLHAGEDGKPGAPALPLISSAAAPTVLRDPVVPPLAGTDRVIGVDLPGYGRTA